MKGVVPHPSILDKKKTHKNAFNNSETCSTFTSNVTRCLAQTNSALLPSNQAGGSIKRAGDEKQQRTFYVGSHPILIKKPCILFNVTRGNLGVHLNPIRPAMMSQEMRE